MKSMVLQRHIIAICALICVGALSCSGATGGGGEAGPCTPGTVEDCTCGSDGLVGTRVCDVAKGTWGQCVCEAADVVAPGADAIAPADGGTGPVGPGPGAGAQGAALAGGAAELTSDQYRLRILVGPLTPVQSVESEQYRLKLGVGLSK